MKFDVVDVPILTDNFGCMDFFVNSRRKND
jgi:hypothetical protein